MSRKIISLLIALMLFAFARAETVIQFEDGQTLGGVKINGTWVDGLKAKGDGASVSFTINEEGEYDISVIQASQNGSAMKNDLLIDGEKIGEIIAEGTEFNPYTLKNVHIAKGGHELSVMRNYGWVRLDSVVISKSPEITMGVYEVDAALSNPNASLEAKALMEWLCENYGVNMISGQYLNEGDYGQEIYAIGKATGGLYPALLGLDMMNYSPSSVSLGTHPISVDQAMEYWKQGHVLTFCWHWVAPEKYLNVNGNKWWSGFRTDSTSFSLKSALNGEDPEGYELLLRDMDAIAEQLKRFRDMNIPIIWRPLHEASGGWFWWGASGRDAYVELYRLMYDRFTNLHGLNNLIWLWNGQSAYWYPGDDVVDIIGEDVYAGNHAHDSQKNAFLRCISYTNARKLIMLSECGCVPSPIACARDESLWSAWCTWCYEFVLNSDGSYAEAYTDAERLKMFYECENVITLKDVPDFGRDLSKKDDKAEDDGVLRFEFENGEMRGAAKAAGQGETRWADISGNAETDGVTLNIAVPESAEYEITIIQAGIGGYKENYISIDGVRQEQNAVVQGSDWENSLYGSVYLEEGEHVIDIDAFWGWVKLDALVLKSESAEDEAIMVEIEDGALSGEVKIAALGAQRWVELRSNDENDSVTLIFQVSEEGDYDLTIRAAGIGGYKENYLTLDGERIENTIVNGEAWEDCVTPSVHLEAGEHDLKISCFWGWCKLDWLKVEKSK